MTITEMKEKKQEWGYTNEMIAQISGVPLGTVQKIFAGITASPRYDTLQALERVFCPDSSLVCEAAEPYFVKRQGDYTLKDYYALPDDRRVELIDGVIYDMTAPTNPHQMIQGELFFQLKSYINGKKGPCIPFMAPADVQLDADDKTMVEPDVFVVCDRNKITKSHTIGAPDLVMEILSPSTWRKDSYTKLAKYTLAGVREYWIIDPETLKIMVYDLENNTMAQLYTFKDYVPVLIFGSDCKIDFPQIYEKMKFLYE